MSAKRRTLVETLYAMGSDKMDDGRRKEIKENATAVALKPISHSLMSAHCPLWPALGPKRSLVLTGRGEPRVMITRRSDQVS